MPQWARCACTWPGNVRELHRFIERAVPLTESNHLQLDDLPPQLRGEYVEVLDGPISATTRETRRANPARQDALDRDG
jgi:transcriptional regulator of acetoin/glycerol metabolism